MSVLLFGVSHRSAPVEVLERISVSEFDRPKLVGKLLNHRSISEAMLVSTCNRIEIYAVADAFHPALEAVGEVLGEHSGMSINDLTKHAYVRYLRPPSSTCSPSPPDSTRWSSANSRSSDRSVTPT